MLNSQQHQMSWIYFKKHLTPNNAVKNTVNQYVMYYLEII